VPRRMAIGGRRRVRVAAGSQPGGGVAVPRRLDGGGRRRVGVPVVRVGAGLVSLAGAAAMHLCGAGAAAGATPCVLRPTSTRPLAAAYARIGRLRGRGVQGQDVGDGGVGVTGQGLVAASPG
jgi:hypothetical protein